MKRLFLTASVLLLAGLLVTTTYAAGPVSRIVLEDTQFIQCNNFPGVFSASFRVVAYDSEGSIANTSPINFQLLTANDYGSSAQNFAADSGQTLTFAAAFPNAPSIDSGTVQVVLASDPSVRSSVYVVDCVNRSVRELTESGSDGIDGRLNRGAGDLLNVLYRATDSSGQPGIAVYGVTDDSRGYLIGVFENALFEHYLDAAPGKVVRLAQLGASTLYALPTGEFQINVGPDINGKTGEVVFRGLPPRIVRLSNFDLYR
jgi:hypothetical protein